MESKLHILWTTADINTAHHMVFMYAINAKTHGWWDDVTIIIWGASARLVAEDAGIQEKIEMAQHQDVHISTCIACAAQFGVVDKLRELGIEVVPWGEPLTELLKNGSPLLSI